MLRPAHACTYGSHTLQLKSTGHLCMSPSQLPLNSTSRTAHERQPKVGTRRILSGSAVNGACCGRLYMLHNVEALGSTPEEGSADCGGAGSRLRVAQGALHSTEAQRLTGLSTRTRNRPAGLSEDGCSRASLYRISQRCASAMHLQAANITGLQAGFFQSQSHHLRAESAAVMSCCKVGAALRTAAMGGH